MTPASPIPASLATACAAHDRHRLDVLDALLDEAAPSAVRELLGAALDLCATLRTERDALAAQLAEVRADLQAAQVDLHAARRTDEDEIDVLRADLASERAHLAACRTRIAGLEQAADERSAEVARLTARVAELEARPVLTEDALSKSLGWTRHVPKNVADETASDVLRHLGPVTLPSPDRAEELCREYHEDAADHDALMAGRWRNFGRGSHDICVKSMRRALAKLSPAPAREAAPTLVAVSDEELMHEFYTGAENGTRPVNGIRAVRAKLGAAEVTEERVKAALKLVDGITSSDDLTDDESLDERATFFIAHLCATAAKGG